MKTAKTRPLMRRVSEKSRVAPYVSRFIHEDGSSSCARNAFYVQAAAVHGPEKEAYLVREHDAADFSYIYDFMYIASGEGIIECDDKKIPMKAGRVYIINRLHPHKYYPIPEDPYASYWIHVAGTLMDDFFAMLGITEGVLWAEGEEYFDDFEYMNRILLRIKLGVTERQAGYEEIASVLFGVVLAATREKRRTNYISSFDREERGIKFNFVELAKDYCDRNIALDITVQRLADKIKYSASHLSREFAKVFDISLVNYIMKQKIGYAKHILETSSAPIDLIAASLNFSNIQHFSNMFSKYVGCSPTVYRKQHSRIRAQRDPDSLLF